MRRGKHSGPRCVKEEADGHEVMAREAEADQDKMKKNSKKTIYEV